VKRCLCILLAGLLTSYSLCVAAEESLVLHDATPIRIGRVTDLNLGAPPESLITIAETEVNDACVNDEAYGSRGANLAGESPTSEAPESQLGQPEYSCSPTIGSSLTPAVQQAPQ
jgi:hypothetical protein